MQESQVENETTRGMIEQILQTNTELTQLVHQLSSEHQQVEDQLIKTNRIESVAVLAGGIAHDFNNILTTILGNVSLAKMLAPQDEKLVRRLSNAERAILRAQDLTRQLLTMTTDHQSAKQLASVCDVIREAVDFSLRGSPIRYELALPSGVWPVEMAPGQISQVIHNLMINAEHAMPDGGVIHVQVENRRVAPPLPTDLQTLVPGPYVHIAIQDCGTGIEAAHLPSIFVPYFTTKTEGSGLGLASAYAIMTRHHGTIYAESEVGVGTTFHLYLPASPTRQMTRPDTFEPPIMSGTRHILIMEDDEALHDVVGGMLDIFGYEVVLTQDGHETLTAYLQAREAGAPFDAVILDLTIPGGMGARKTVDELLAIDPQVKAIVASGYATDPVLADFESYGFSGSIAKPYCAKQLHQILCEVLDTPNPSATTGEPTDL